MLKEKQQEIFDNVIQDVRSGVKRIKIVGSAGTGKTYLVTELVNKFAEILPKYRPIYVTAPTNKALSILSTKITNTPPNVIFKTIHSSLSLKMFVDNKTGIATFKRGWSDKRDPFRFDKCSVCFVDESSMLNKELLDMLDEMDFCIIFIGDKKQLNPVGEEVSPIWERDYKQYELTEIIRQGAGNPIIDLSNDLLYITSRVNKLVEDKGYIFDNNKEYILNKLAEANGTDELKYVSWTNNSVNLVNEAVRKRIYGEFPNKVELGETLIMDEPFGEHFTNKEIKVESLRVIDDLHAFMPNGLSKFDANCEPLNTVDPVKLKFYLINENIKVIHEDSEIRYFEVVNEITNGCKKLAWEWRGLFYFQGQFAKVKYNHAITAHKSQGSTYKSAVVNIGEMMKNKNRAERNRLIYTAITRASDLLILTNVK